MMVFWALAMPSLAALILVAYCFKYAKMAGINQGCMPCIFTAQIFYVSLLFYCKFGEKISKVKLLGTVLMVPCIIFISLGGRSSHDSASSAKDEDVSEGETIADGPVSLEQIALISIAFALIAPVLWTVMAFYSRVAEPCFNFNLFDLAIDA